jgi:hypothetical protein
MEQPTTKPPATKCSIKKPTSPHNRYIQTLLTTSQPLLYPNLIKDAWGHALEPIDVGSTFCILFNNVNGLKLSSDPVGI